MSVKKDVHASMEEPILSSSTEGNKPNNIINPDKVYNNAFSRNVRSVKHSLGMDICVENLPKNIRCKVHR